MTPQQAKLKKLSTFASNPQLALLDELEAISTTLQTIAEKPEHKCEMPMMPEMPSMDKTNELLQEVCDKEMPMTDLSKVEKLLTQLIEKEKKSEPIDITLEII